MSGWLSTAAGAEVHSPRKRSRLAGSRCSTYCRRDSNRGGSSLRGAGLTTTRRAWRRIRSTSRDTRSSSTAGTPHSASGRSGGRRATRGWGWCMGSLIVCSCDQTYFPMVKGLVLSITESGALPANSRMAFLNLGLDGAALQWLENQGVLVRELTHAAVGELADPRLGYQRAQACRPFLPRLFPDEETLIWMDSDMWVQEPGVLAALVNAVAERPDHLFIAPEWHYSYVYINDDIDGRHAEMYSYYAPVYGETVARRLSKLPTLNSGFFAMRADNPI